MRGKGIGERTAGEAKGRGVQVRRRGFDGKSAAVEDQAVWSSPPV